MTAQCRSTGRSTITLSISVAKTGNVTEREQNKKQTTTTKLRSVETKQKTKQTKLRFVEHSPTVRQNRFTICYKVQPGYHAVSVSRACVEGLRCRESQAIGVSRPSNSRRPA